MAADHCRPLPSRTCQLGFGTRRALSEAHQEVVRQHLEGRAIELTSLAIPVVPQGTKHPLGALIHASHALHPKKGRVLINSTRPLPLLEQGALLVHCVEPSLLLQTPRQELTKCCQPVGITARILQVLVEQRSLCPVVALILLVDVHPKEVIDEVRQTDLGHAKEHR